jgi:hypothetical protein
MKTSVSKSTAIKAKPKKAQPPTDPKLKSNINVYVRFRPLQITQGQNEKEIDYEITSKKKIDLRSVKFPPHV